MPGLGLDDDDLEQKVAQITFAFFNEKIINWLKQRGKHLQLEEYDKVHELNNEIAENLRAGSDPTLLDHLQTPCAAFVTFEHEEGFNRAIILNEQVQQGSVPRYFEYLLTEKLEISAATEPSDIIWENRYFTKN